MLGCLVLPFAAEAQQGAKSARVSILYAGAPPTEFQPALTARLAELGWKIEYVSRNADGRAERLPVIAADLVRLCT
jgi:hypothetical protein